MEIENTTNGYTLRDIEDAKALSSTFKVTAEDQKLVIDGYLEACIGKNILLKHLQDELNKHIKPSKEIMRIRHISVLIFSLILCLFIWLKLLTIAWALGSFVGFVFFVYSFNSNINYKQFK